MSEWDGSHLIDLCHPPYLRLLGSNSDTYTYTGGPAEIILPGGEGSTNHEPGLSYTWCFATT